MKKTLLALLLCFASTFDLQPALARNLSQAEKSKAHDPSETLHGAWFKGVNTAIQIKGNPGTNIEKCKQFDIKLGKVLSFQIECHGKVRQGELSLENGDHHTVSKHGQRVTITRFNYLIKKTQTSRFERSSLKIPYVEEIIHVQKKANGELAFYIENFKVDVFGRIVQDNYIQAFGLSVKEMKVSLKN